MTDWKGFLYCAFLLSFMTGIYQLLCKNKTEYSKQMQFAAGVLSIALFCVPAVQNGFSFTFPDFQYSEQLPAQNEEAIFVQALLKESKVQLELQWQNALEEKFDLSKSDCKVEVKVTWKNQTVNCQDMTVSIFKKDSYMQKDIETYCNRYADCNVRVIVLEEKE